MEVCFVAFQSNCFFSIFPNVSSHHIFSSQNGFESLSEATPNKRQKACFRSLFSLSRKVFCIAINSDTIGLIDLNQIQIGRETNEQLKISRKRAIDGNLFKGG